MKDQFKDITSEYKGFVITRECVFRSGTSYYYRSGSFRAPRKKDVTSHIDELLDKRKILEFEIRALEPAARENNKNEQPRSGRKNFEFDGMTMQAIIELAESRKIYARSINCDTSHGQTPKVEITFINGQDEETIKSFVDELNKSKPVYHPAITYQIES